MGQIKTPIFSDSRPYYCDPVAASVTGTLVETTLKSYPFPGRPCNTQGSIRLKSIFTAAAGSTLRCKLGGVTLYTATAPASWDLIIAFNSSYAAEIIYNASASSASGGVKATAAVDCTVPVTLDITAQLALVGDTVSLFNSVILVNAYP